MKRDMNLIRDLLLEIEANDDGSGRDVKIATDGHSQQELTEHLFMLYEAGFIEGIDASHMQGRVLLVQRLTWHGHEFLEVIRDQSIWEKTQDGMKQAGGFSIDLAKALAKGFIKKNVERYTGVEIDL